MDCNKEEASRAKALAKTKMQSNDFSGAQKLVMKAQKLYPDLESLPQMLAVCDIHVSADSKINGLENWYGILQVMHFSDDVTIKKQYKKLALLLHPDKNRFPGAETAFKLVCNASKLLGDKEKRSQYDIRRRIFLRCAEEQLTANSGQQLSPAGNGSDSVVNPVTFWTCCEHCGFRYKYMRNYVNALLHCSHCERSYKAYDTGAEGVPSNANTGQQDVQNQGPKHVDSSSAPSCEHKGETKNNMGSGYQEFSSTKDKGSENCEASGEGVFMAGNHEKTSEKPISQDLPDPEFNNFELTTTSCFAVNQVWSLYDPTDGMPRLYARIDRVLDSKFKLRITWIDPSQDSKNNSIPIACGVFQVGDSVEVDDRLMFSCQMLHVHQNNSKIIILPRIGEIWAVFSGWDLSWSCSSETRKQPYEYDYVEILSDYKDEAGLGVAYLGKVEGFVSLFRRDERHGVLQFQIPPNEMLRFSHKVPSFKMTGKEREDVPPGCFELDTAALPKEMFEADNCKVDAGLDRDGVNGKTCGPFPEASKVGMRANTNPERRPSSKKRRKVHDNHGSDGRCTNHERNSTKKSRKSVKAVDDVQLRKSPRLLSKTNSQATPRSTPNKVGKKNVNKSYGRGDEPCISGEKTTVSNKPEKIVATDSSGNVKAPQDTKKHGRNDESLSQVRGAKESSDTETHVPVNFENQRSWDKFQIGQVWAIYSSDKGIPRKYAQIKKIDALPEFKLHVAPLVLYPPQEQITHPVCCGRFKLKMGKAEVLFPSDFSHQVKAVKGKKNILEVFPGKGEIWALYKNWTVAEELEIVEVVDTDEELVQVVSLTAQGFNKHLYGRSQNSTAGFVDILKTEVSRFSHQIPAFRHLRNGTRFGDCEYWELDPKAILDFN